MQDVPGYVVGWGAAGPGHGPSPASHFACLEAERASGPLWPGGIGGASTGSHLLQRKSSYDLRACDATSSMSRRQSELPVSPVGWGAARTARATENQDVASSPSRDSGLAPAGFHSSPDDCGVVRAEPADVQGVLVGWFHRYGPSLTLSDSTCQHGRVCERGPTGGRAHLAQRTLAVALLMWRSLVDNGRE